MNDSDPSCRGPGASIGAEAADRLRAIADGLTGQISLRREPTDAVGRAHDHPHVIPRDGVPVRRRCRGGHRGQEHHRHEDCLGHTCLSGDG